MTTDNPHIPSGYKPSPLGIIPEDWEVKRLGEVCINDGDYGLNAPATDYDENLPTYLRITDIDDDGNFNQSDKKSVNSPLSENYYLKDGDIVFARTGATVGKTYLYDKNDGELVYAGFLIKFTPDKEKILPYYLKSQTNTREYANWVSITSQRSGQPGINAAEYCSYKFALPPLAEQKRICNLLSLWDTAIAKQTTLIEQLTLRKRGLMQQLLTGKKRLKGFEGEWKEVRMQDLASFAGGGTPSTKRSDFWEGTIPWISSSDLVEDCLTNNESRYITEEAIANSTTQLLPSKSILIVTRVGVGKVAIAEHPICVSQDFTCLTKYDADTLFLAYSLLLTMKKKKSQSQGTSIKGVSTDEISKIKLLLPSIEEQKAIASVLINADKEIEIQKQKLAAMQEQKKGLMQVLLTGKRRTK